MIEHIITILIILIIVAFLKLYYLPNKALNWYKNTIEALGYKVKLYPLEFLGCPVFS